MASANVIAPFDTYDSNVETIDSSLERLDAYFQANDIGQGAANANDAVRTAADKKKTARLISCVGRFTYGVLRDICSPHIPMKRRLMNCVHYSRITSSRKKLLGKDNSVDEVVKIALADEAAAKEVSHVHVCSVNYVKPRTTTAHVSQHQITLSPIIRPGRENLQM